MPKFMKVATTDELEDQQAKLVEVEGQKIALFRVGEAFHALSDTCTHRGGPLSEGTVEGAEVTCPWHGARFDIKTGGGHGAASGTRGQELPGAGHRRRHRDRSVRPGLPSDPEREDRLRFGGSRMAPWCSSGSGSFRQVPCLTR
jgi:3-phenylpropionate/trans-cinnamate dioxygenase ferredoxin component